jgi:ribosome biogenesis GTPase
MVNQMNSNNKIHNSDFLHEDLLNVGWNIFFQDSYADYSQDRIVRVLSAQRGRFLVSNGKSEWYCSSSGALKRGDRTYPVTGDWCIADEQSLIEVLPRKNILARGKAGSNGKNSEVIIEQPIATNIDTVFIVCGLDRDYNLRRIERYLALVYSCAISPVVVMTKSDLIESHAEILAEIMEVAPGVPVVLTSMFNSNGISQLQEYLQQGMTVALLGSSGAGKSTLVNTLYGSEVRVTGAVSTSVGKGRHTTTSRDLLRMPGGGMLMDNPGMREIVFNPDENGINAVFPDIQKLSEKCRFADCSHLHEPGCAVREAVELGEITVKRLASYHKMKSEQEYAAEKMVKSSSRIEKDRRKGIALKRRSISKFKY